MKRRCLYGFMMVVLMGHVHGLHGQVQFRASTDRDEILIGEPINLQLNLLAPLGTEARFQLPDSIPHFNILKRGEWVSADGIDGKKWTQQLVITGFDSGHWQIPPLVASVDGRNYYSDTVGITVGYAPFNATAPYRDIKTMEPVAEAPVRYWPWALAAAAALLLALALYFWFRKKPAVAVAPPAPLSPYEQAMRELESLKKGGFHLDGEAKPFYTSLNDIFRVYLSRQYGLNSLGRTNDEIILQLAQYPLGKEKYNELVLSLRTADFVKFARYLPPDGDNEKNYAVIRNAIDLLNTST